MSWMLCFPCLNERKGSVKFSHGWTLPVTDCELIFEDEMLLKWLITKLKLNCQDIWFYFYWKKSLLCLWGQNEQNLNKSTLWPDCCFVKNLVMVASYHQNNCGRRIPSCYCVVWKMFLWRWAARNKMWYIH